MKKIIVIAGAFLLPLIAVAQEESGAAPAQDAAVSAARENMNMLYSLGFMMGENMKSTLSVKDGEEALAVSQGLRDSLQNKAPQVNPEDYRGAIRDRYESDARARAVRQKEEQDAFIAAKKKEKGVRTIDDGIMIQTLKEGKGKSPRPDSTVKVHYHGTLIDGKVFDSSVERGQPIEFPLDNVIVCWRKGVPKMKIGEKARLICPPEVAYGNRQAGAIPPNSLLIFDVELLEIK